MSATGRLLSPGSRQWQQCDSRPSPSPPRQGTQGCHRARRRHERVHRAYRRQGSGPQPASSNTKRNAGALARPSRQARRPANPPAAGIDAASMARRCQSPLKERECFSSPADTSPAAGRAGAPLAGAPGATRVEAPGPPAVPPSAAPSRARGRRRSYGTRGIRPSRPDSDARQAGERSPCPACRAGHAGQREANCTDRRAYPAAPRSSSPSRPALSGPRPGARSAP
jgi:hypothetical protein